VLKPPKFSTDIFEPFSFAPIHTAFFRLTIIYKLLGVLLLGLLLSAAANADDSFASILPGCTAKLERRNSEPDVILVRGDCRMNISSLALLLETGLRELFPDNHLPIHGIYLGRVMNYPEWSKKLAMAAAQSPAWNNKRGWPYKPGQGENQLVQVLLNGPAYPQPLQAVFARYGLTACIVDVEKVLVFKAKDIFPTPVTLGKLKAEAKLPIDAQVWLRLSPLASRCE